MYFKGKELIKIKLLVYFLSFSHKEDLNTGITLRHMGSTWLNLSLLQKISVQRKKEKGQLLKLKKK